MELIIRQAETDDFDSITNLLTSNDLPVADLIESNVNLFIGSINNTIVSSVGLEKYNSIALFRSLAVDRVFRNQSIGTALINRIFDYCISEKIEELYLLTTTAAGYFEKHGFEKVTRDSVPLQIKQTQEYTDICPVSAVAMKKSLNQ